MALGFSTQILRNQKATEQCHQNSEGKYFQYRIVNPVKSSVKHEGENK